MTNYEELKTRPRAFLAATSLTVEEFERLLPAFEAAYQARYGRDKTVEGEPRQRQVGGGAKGKLPRMADKLLFILVYEKTYPLQTMQGLHFGLSQGQTNMWIHRLLPIVQEALAALGLKPARDASAWAESETLKELPADFLIDGTERRHQRPQDQEQQVAAYSGKKKAHTDKNLLIVHSQTDQVLYLGPTEPGKTHDKKLVDQAQIEFPVGATLGKDTGFQGYEPPGVVTYQPKKKPKGRELSGADKFLNRIFSRIRIRVEHVIAWVKRCRIVKDVFRNTKENFSDLAMEVACGLHNFRVACRHPAPTIRLIDLRH